MNYDDFKIIIKEKQVSNKRPFSLTFELSPLCNFDCKMCYVHRNLKVDENIKTTSDWIEIAREAFEAGVFFITLTGGEVFLYPHFRELYEAIYDMGFYIVILSNAYLIDDSIVEWLSKRKPSYIKTTIYGASNETYKKVCGVNDGFDKVTENLLKLKNAGINVLTTMTVIQQNETDVSLVKQWAKEHGFTIYVGAGIRQTVRGAERDIDSVRVLPKLDEKKLIPLKELRKLYPYVNGKPFSCCKSYREHAFISWQFNMLGCTFVNSISEKCIKGKLINSYRRLWDRLDQIKQPSKCDTCKYQEWCNPCPGNVEGESGCLTENSKYLCDVARYNYYALNYTNNDLTENSIDTTGCD